MSKEGKRGIFLPPSAQLRGAYPTQNLHPYADGVKSTPSKLLVLPSTVSRAFGACRQLRERRRAVLLAQTLTTSPKHAQGVIRQLERRVGPGFTERSFVRACRFSTARNQCKFSVFRCTQPHRPDIMATPSNGPKWQACELPVEGFFHDGQDPWRLPNDRRERQRRDGGRLENRGGQAPTNRCS